MAKIKKKKEEETVAEEMKEIFFVRFKRIFFRTLKITTLAAFIIIMGFLIHRLHFFLCKSPYFKVRKVEVIGGSEEFKRELLEFAMLDDTESININLVRLNTRRLKSRLEKFPKLRTAEVIKSYPSTLKIYAQPRRAVAIVSGRKLFLADSEGVVMEPLKPEKRGEFPLPVMTGLEENMLRIGNTITDETYFKGLDIQTSLKRHSSRLYDNLSELNMNSRGEISLIFRGGTEIRLGRRYPLKRLPELEAFLQEYAPTQRGYEKFKYVDLRFKKQIVYALRDESRERRVE